MHAGPTNTCSLPAAERQGSVEFVFDLEESVKHHGAAVVQVHRVGRHVGLVAARGRVVAVNFKGLDVLGL